LADVTDKAGNQKTLYYATSNSLCFCTFWQNGETRKLHFHSNAVLVESAAAVGRVARTVRLRSSVTSILGQKSTKVIVNLSDRVP